MSDAFHHRMTILLDQGAYPRVICPFDSADETRPCWPHDEHGTPFDSARGDAEGCVYKDWLDELGMDAVEGTAEVTFTMSATWEHDYFTFHIGEQAPGDADLQVAVLREAIEARST